MGRRGRASACPRSRTGQVIWLAAALLLLAIAVLALWLYETHGAPDGQSAETRQVPPIPPAGGEGLPPAVRNGQAVVQTVADTVAVVGTTAPTDADDGNIVTSCFVIHVCSFSLQSIQRAGQWKNRQIWLSGPM